MPPGCLRRGLQGALKSPTEKGRRIRVRRAVRAAHEPWLLATPLSDGFSREIVETYD
jgi:hypothetical protein